MYLFAVKRSGPVKLRVGSQTILQAGADGDELLSARVELEPGRPSFAVEFGMDEGAHVAVSWSGPDFGLQPLGADALGHAADVLPVVE